MAVAALAAGLTAKEAVLSTFGVLLGVGAAQLPQALGGLFTAPAACSFLVFTALYPPCAASMSVMSRELGSGRRALLAAAAQCAAAWIAAFFVYRLLL